MTSSSTPTTERPAAWTWVALLHSPTDQVSGSVFADPRFGLHAGFLKGLAEQGLLVAAGPLDDAAGEGMAVVRLPGEDQLEQAITLAQSDPSVVAGLFSVRVRPWRVLMSGIPDC